MKRKKLLYAAACAAGLLGLFGCEDNSRQYLDEYDTLVYFRNGGEQNVTLYSVGNNARYQIPVCKGGSEPEACATARIVMMDQSQLDIYNMAAETRYVQLPEDCYEFLTPTELDFMPADRYRVAEVELKTDRIRERQEGAGSDLHYVLALQVYSQEKVSRDINRLILVPEVDVPVVTFSLSGKDAYDFTPDSPEDNIISSSLSINMPASSVEWTFDCTLEALGQDWLDAYNAGQGTDYVLLADDKYTLPEKVVFEAGKAEAPFEVVVNRTGFSPFEYFAIPVRLASCSKPELQVDGEAVYLILVRLTPSLESVTLTESMLSSPYTAGYDGGGIPALVDGDEETFWHSCWGGDEIAGDPVYGSYIDIELPSPLNVVKFSYSVRHNNNNAYPTVIRIGVSNDGETWEMIGEANGLNYEIPTAGKAWGILPTFYSPDAFKYIRFGLAVSIDGDMTNQQTQSKSTAMGELRLEGATL